MSRDIKFGVVGAAGRGKNFFSAMTSNPNVEITALCDINKEALNETAAENDLKCLLYPDYEEMIEQSGVDAVLIGTPMHFHVPQVIMALERGKVKS